MTTEINIQTETENSEDFLPDTESLLNIDEEKRAQKLRELDFEISILERAYLGSDENPDLPKLSEKEQRHLNWMLSWEGFDSLIEKNAEVHAAQYKAENDALANLALAKLYRSCGEVEVAQQHEAISKKIVTDFYTQYKKSLDALSDTSPFQNETLASWIEEMAEPV